MTKLTNKEDPRIPKGLEIKVDETGQVIECNDAGAFAEYVDKLERWERDILRSGRVSKRERAQ